MTTMFFKTYIRELFQKKPGNLPPDNLSTLYGGVGLFLPGNPLTPAYIVFLACLPLRLKSEEIWTTFKEGWCVITRGPINYDGMAKILLARKQSKLKIRHMNHQP